jgi:hypothetical protein
MKACPVQAGARPHHHARERERHGGGAEPIACGVQRPQRCRDGAESLQRHEGGGNEPEARWCGTTPSPALIAEDLRGVAAIVELPAMGESPVLTVFLRFYDIQPEHLRVGDVVASPCHDC